MAFVDGQNLFHHARREFGRTYPDYDISALSRRVCERLGCALAGVRFYTGLPRSEQDSYWNKFWERKLQVMRDAGVHTYSRLTQPRTKSTRLYDGVGIEFPDGRPPRDKVDRFWLEDGTEVPEGSLLHVGVSDEKGIDVRLSIDLVRLAWAREYDTAVIFSQDQDLTEATDAVKEIGKEQSRMIRLVSAFPQPSSGKGRGVDRTTWVPFSEAEYCDCLDPRDYRKR